MLVLTRRVGEAIYIGADIKVVILGIKGNQVRIGTEAPDEVAVHREEIDGRGREDAAPSGGIMTAVRVSGRGQFRRLGWRARS